MSDIAARPSDLIEQIRAAGGTRMNGPSALTSDWRRGAALTWTLAYLEFRLKFFGSVLGYLWQLGRPLLMFGVYFVIFTEVVHLGQGVKYYAAMLLASIMLFQFYAEVTAGSVQAVLNRENLVRKIHFPRIVIPLSVVTTGALNLAVNSIAIVVFMAIQGVPVRLSWLVLIPALAMLLIFITGLSMLLSALFVKYRDVQPIWDVVLQAGFYASPILYPIETVSSSWARTLIMCNPLSTVIQQIRHSVFDKAAPSAADAIGGAPLLAIPIGITVGLFALGFWVFNRTAPEVAENL
jgi:ABC-2 type transport system permease protein